MRLNCTFFVLIILMIMSCTIGCFNENTSNDIETSKKETTGFLIQSYIDSAQYNLELAREIADTTSVESEIYVVREYLGRANLERAKLGKAALTFGDIGTSREELKTLLIKGYVFSTNLCLEAARVTDLDKSTVNGLIEYMYKHLEKANLERVSLGQPNLTLADFNTSEEELSHLLGATP